MRYNAPKKRARYKDQVIEFIVNVLGENRSIAASQAQAWVNVGSRYLTGEVKENIHHALCHIDIIRKHMDR